MLRSRLFGRRGRVGYEHDAYTPDAVVQWWYLVGRPANGWLLSTYLLPRGLGDSVGHPSDSPVLGIVLRSPDGQIMRERSFFTPEQLSARSDRLQVELGKRCRLSFDGATRRFNFAASVGRLAYELELVPELAPWTPFSKAGKAPRAIQALLRKDLFTRDYLQYASFVPRGRLSGRILIDGEQLDASGTAYHEKGSISYPLCEMLPVWRWLHIEHDGWTVLAGSGAPPSWVPVGRIRGGIAFVAKEDRQLMSLFDPTGLLVRWQVLSWAKPPYPGSPPLAWDVEARLRRPGLQIGLRLESLEVLDSMSFEHSPPTPERPYWCQTVAEAAVELRHGRHREAFTTEAVLETMVTGMKSPQQTARE
jgi:hypothetical protein